MEDSYDQGIVENLPGENHALEMYEGRIKENLSVPLWFEYVKFVETNDSTVVQGVPEGIQKMRKLFERALAATGIHFSEGGKIWEAYRAFEQTVLLQLDESGTEGKGKQVEVIRSIFRRQLTIPLAGLAGTLEEYTKWELQQGVDLVHQGNALEALPMNVQSAYKKALGMCSVRKELEEKVMSGKPADAELLGNYLEYIAVEEATGEPARAQILYERAITEFPASSDLWLKYIQYVEKNLKVASVLRNVYSRAVHNCQWEGLLWKNYLLMLERSGAQETEVSPIFEQSLLGGYNSPQEYLDLFLVRVDGLRRRISRIRALAEMPEQVSDVVLLRDTFNRASQFMSTYFPDFVDRTFQLEAYWADIEAHLLHDLTAARAVWKNLIKSSGWMIEVWQAFILMEQTLNNIKEVRDIYRTCYSRRLEGNGTEVICSAWLRFEREHGSLEDYDRAVGKVGARLAEVHAMQVQEEYIAEAVAAEPIPDQVPNTTKSKTRDGIAKNNNKENKVVPVSGKRKRNLGSKDSQVKAKHPKTHNVESVRGTPDCPSTLSGEKNKSEEHLDEVGLSTKEHTTQVTPGASAAFVHPKAWTEECTAFVSNLSFEVNEEQLREFFSSIPGLKEIRLLKDRFSGRPRGLAYAEFDSEQSLEAAILKNKEELCGRCVSVARSDPKNHLRGGRSQSSIAHGDTRGESYKERKNESRSGGRGQGGRSGFRNRGRGKDQDAGLGLGHRRGGKLSLTGTITFAVPRSVVRQQGLGAGQVACADEVPKSNDDFRKLLLGKGEES